MDDTEELWKGVDQLATEVAAEFGGAGVARIEATPYEDSLGRAGVHFTVWLRDKRDDSDYEWAELRPIEQRLSERMLALDADRIPYTDYVLESEAEQRAAATR